MRVLAIDDEPLMLTLYEMVLGIAGLTIVPFRDPADALVWAAGHFADAVICDLRMRPLDGYDVVRTLRALAAYGPIPIVVCTASDESEDALLRAGFSAVVRKPFTAEALLAAIGVDRVSGPAAGSRPLAG